MQLHQHEQEHGRHGPDHSRRHRRRARDVGERAIARLRARLPREVRPKAIAWREGASEQMLNLRLGICRKRVGAVDTRTSFFLGKRSPS